MCFTPTFTSSTNASPQLWDNNLRAQGFVEAFTDKCRFAASPLPLGADQPRVFRSATFHPSTARKELCIMDTAIPTPPNTATFRLRCSPNPTPTRAASSRMIALKELAESIRSQGVLSPLLVRPLNEHGFEIVFGATALPRRADGRGRTVPVRIKSTSPMPKRWRRS